MDAVRDEIKIALSVSKTLEIGKYPDLLIIITQIFIYFSAYYGAGWPFKWQITLVV